MPSLWLNGRRNGGCCECEKEYKLKNRKKREIVFDDGDLRCMNHPERSAKRSVYVRRGRRFCSSCRHRRADGSRYPAHERGVKKRDYARSMKLRSHLRSTIRGLKLFERSTGMSLSGWYEDQKSLAGRLERGE
jgi:hypothetical protein